MATLVTLSHIVMILNQVFAQNICIIFSSLLFVKPLQFKLVIHTPHAHVRNIHGHGLTYHIQRDTVRHGTCHISGTAHVRSFVRLLDVAHREGAAVRADLESRGPSCDWRPVPGPRLDWRRFAGG